MSLDPDRKTGTVVALCGGVGGAKLALGLAHALQDERLLVAVNTGDDFEHLGLHVSPDIDTVIYTLAGLANPETGWGVAEESWNFMASLEALGGETWFRLGDKDLAMHVERTRRLRAGEPLSAVTDRIRRRLGIVARVLPMSDDPVRTIVETAAGPLPFQRYFVERQCEPALKGVHYDGAGSARACRAIVEALGRPDLEAVILCPSNPHLSIGPILALPDLAEALRETQAPVVAVSPIVGGAAVKGPAAKIMRELGVEVSPAGVATHYGGLLDGLVIDLQDADMQREIRVSTRAERTVMTTLEDKIALARACLAFAGALAAGGAKRTEQVA